ncbi:hypothetical protein OAA06_02350, partial [bacterium]|nr:hypothetical protein [bacterium]
YRANQGSNYIPSRAITDGKYKLIWNCNTVFTSGARQSFQWKMPSYRDWESHYRKGEYTGIQSYFFEPMVTFEFYDLESDPYETINLASDPAYAELLDEHIAALQAKVRSTNDISFFPNSIRNLELPKINLHDWIKDNDYDMEQLYQAVELASMAEAEDLDAVVELLKNPETVIRYWGAVGMLRLRFHDKISDLPAIVKDLANNTSENIEVRCLSHMALLCNEDYCECSAFIASHLSETYCQGIIPNVGDKLIPIAGEIYKAGMKTSDFYVKSALINAGVMPYEQLIDVTNLTINQALLDSVGKVDCQEDECSNLVSDEFSSESDLDNWIESPTTDMVNVNGGVLNVLFNKTKVNTSVQRNFSAVSNDNIEFNFTCSFDDNASATYFSLLNEQGKVVASFISGIIGTGGFFAVSELNDLDKRVDKSNVKTSLNFAKGGFTKNTNYNASIRINMIDQTFTVAVNEYVSAVYPLINSATTGITGFTVYVEKMYNNNAGAHIDNFSVISTSPEKIDLSTKVQEVRAALFSTHFGMTDEDLLTEWSSVLDAYLAATEVINDCASLPAQHAGAKATLDEAYDKYLGVLALDIDDSSIESIKSILPEVFYMGDGVFKPELDNQVKNYNFNVYNINGVKVFSSQNQNIGWEGSNPSTPLYLWSLQYQTLDNKTVLQSGKVMVFVD